MRQEGKGGSLGPAILSETRTAAGERCSDGQTQSQRLSGEAGRVIDSKLLLRTSVASQSSPHHCCATRVREPEHLDSPSGDRQTRDWEARVRLYSRHKTGRRRTAIW